MADFRLCLSVFVYFSIDDADWAGVFFYFLFFLRVIRLQNCMGIQLVGRCEAQNVVFFPKQASFCGINLFLF